MDNLSSIERKAEGLECDLTKSKVHEVQSELAGYGPTHKRYGDGYCTPSSFVIADLSFYSL